ncbi:MAG TPA: hypothetical protein DDZ33_07945 [Clostridium sp.]|nr:hypothetical protein [Clostridium sp.]
MEKPILFNTEMVKAILEGKKTVTRRIIKLPKHVEEQENGLYTLYAEGGAYIDAKFETVKDYINSPCKVGDILYVRETWCDTTKDLIDDSDLEVGECRYIFKVDDNGHRQPIIEVDVKRWRPSIHMPKEAARIFLEVTDVSVERLQDITEEGAREEGVRQYTKDGEVFKYAVNEYQYKWSEMPRNPIEAFKKLWDSCYNWPKCWTYNPWVWVIEFKKVENKKD